ncbi:MAG: hypothetical protein K6F09_04150 [Clostridiales bacterium]|nr:hypothetical protein [Clostridiales bacterium]
MFVKIVDEHNITYCPKAGYSETDGRYHTNLPKYYSQHTDIAHADGYYVLVETEPPEREGYHPVPSYVLEGNTVVQHWTLIPDDPSEPTLEDRVETCEEAILEISETVYA